MRTVSFTEIGNNVNFIDTGFMFNTNDWDFLSNWAFGELRDRAALKCEKLTGFSSENSGAGHTRTSFERAP